MQSCSYTGDSKWGFALHSRMNLFSDISPEVSCVLIASCLPYVFSICPSLHPCRHHLIPSPQQTNGPDTVEAALDPTIERFKVPHHRFAGTLEMRMQRRKVIRHSERENNKAALSAARARLVLFSFCVVVCLCVCVQFLAGVYISVCLCGFGQHISVTTTTYTKVTKCRCVVWIKIKF